MGIDRSGDTPVSRDTPPIPSRHTDWENMV